MLAEIQMLRISRETVYIENLAGQFRNHSSSVAPDDMLFHLSSRYLRVIALECFITWEDGVMVRVFACIN